jgi:hypothetical protein
MYGKMRCAYMTSCVAAEGEVLFGKMRHWQQRYGRGPVKISFLHEAMPLVGMCHAKMRQRVPIVRSDMWRCRCVQVLVCETLQLKRVTIDRSSELYHKGRTRAWREDGDVAICVSRWGYQARRVVGQWPVKFVMPWRLKMRPVLHVAHIDARIERIEFLIVLFFMPGSCRWGP